MPRLTRHINQDQIISPAPNVRTLHVFGSPVASNLLCNNGYNDSTCIRRYYNDPELDTIFTQYMFSFPLAIYLEIIIFMQLRENKLVQYFDPLPINIQRSIHKKLLRRITVPEKIWFVSLKSSISHIFVSQKSTFFLQNVFLSELIFRTQLKEMKCEDFEYWWVILRTVGSLAGGLSSLFALSDVKSSAIDRRWDSVSTADSWAEQNTPADPRLHTPTNQATSAAEALCSFLRGLRERDERGGCM